MQRILNWLIASSWFKKYSAFFGGLALGMYVQAKYWREIKATLNIWGISSNEWLQFLWAVMGASAIALSIGLSLAKSRREAKARDNRRK